ncbi:MAG: hypothetical protein ACHQRM_05885 [Bacteroidia bacterium]
MKSQKNKDREKPLQAGQALTYQDGILNWKLEEGHWYTAEMVEEELTCQTELTGHHPHALLLNAGANAVINLECTDRILSHLQPYRKAVAIVTGENLATYLMINFYVNKSPYKRSVRLFKTEAAALAWLEQELVKAEGC